MTSASDPVLKPLSLAYIRGDFLESPECLFQSELSIDSVVDLVQDRFSSRSCSCWDLSFKLHYPHQHHSATLLHYCSHGTPSRCDSSYRPLNTRPER